MAFCTLLGGAFAGLTLPAIYFSLTWLHPLASSSLLWAAGGALAGLCGFATGDHATRRPRFSLFMALGWGFATAACAGGGWAAVLVIARMWFGVSFTSNKLADGAGWLAIFSGALGEGYGLFVGGFVGFLRGREQRFASAVGLGFAGGVFGALGGVLSVLAVATAPKVAPVASSSLAWAALGFIAGLGGYIWSRATREQAERWEEDDAPPEGKTIQWVLRERVRRRRERPLPRVLPVLIVSIASLVGAAAVNSLEPAVALVAVGALGLTAAPLLYGQDRRLRALERRLGRRE
jgi:MFS family permease